MRKIPELDGLRAFAVLPVVILHFSYLRWVPGGYLGVDLFFVLSGFLITSLLVAEERAGAVSLRDFYMRRALRILPPLAAAVLLALAFDITGVRGALATIFFASNMVDTPILGGLLHTWSLAVEEHFYVAWPLLFIALGPRRLRFLAWVILLVLCIRVVLLSMRMNVYTPTYTRIDSLAIGCYAALVLASAAPPKLARWLGPASLAAIVACFLFVPYGDFLMQSFGFTLFAILAAAVIVVALGHEGVVNRFLRAPFMQYVGRRSYGLYLYHMPVFLGLERFRVDGDDTSMAMVSVARVVLTVAVTELSYRTIEAWARRYGTRFRPPRAAALQPA